MRFQLDSGTGNLIQSYDNQGIVIRDQCIRHSVLVSAGRLESWPVTSFAGLDATTLAALAGHGASIVLLGTGNTLRFPPVDALAALQRQGIGVEVMRNDAAIRTYNVLLSEDRDVLLALLQE